MSSAKEVEFNHRGVPGVVRGTPPWMHRQGAQTLLARRFFSCECPDGPDLFQVLIVRDESAWQPAYARGECPLETGQKSAA